MPEHRRHYIHFPLPPFQIGHSAFHKLGRLEDEWTFVLPILVKRIVAQYADLRQYKKDSLCKVEKKLDRQQQHASSSSASATASHIKI